jgi:CRISPR/Cas system-associated protein endoribonuclease Cas2
MNIILDISNFQVGYLYFLQPKQNMIMDGTFSKIIYSNDIFSLNCIYLHLPLEIQYVEKNCNKFIAKLLCDSSINSNIIQELSKIENRIIEYYKQINPNKGNKTPLITIHKQLLSGNLRLYKNYTISNEDVKNSVQFILKISGIWESHSEVGLTYKIIEVFS